MRLGGILVCAFLVFAPCSRRVYADFTLTVLHTNDVHSHIDESSKYGGLCTENREQCVGGIARIVTKVSIVMPHALLLSRDMAIDIEVEQKSRIRS